MSERTLEQVLMRRRDCANPVVDVDEPSIKLVIFALGDDWFACRGDSVREILNNVEVFFVPGCPAALEGVINVRGEVASVIGLARVLALGGSSAASMILMVHSREISSGVRVDRVVDVVDVPANAIQPPSGTLPEHLRAFVTGLWAYRDRPVVLLALDRVLDDFARTPAWSGTAPHAAPGVG